MKIIDRSLYKKETVQSLESKTKLLETDAYLQAIEIILKERNILA